MLAFFSIPKLSEELHSEQRRIATTALAARILGRALEWSRDRREHPPPFLGADVPHGLVRRVKAPRPAEMFFVRQQKIRRGKREATVTTIEKFARERRLKLRLDADGTQIIPGKSGDSHIYEYNETKLAFMLMPSRKTSQWGLLRSKLAAPAFEVTQDGDGEGCAVFDHNDTEAVRLVLNICRIFPKRLVSPETASAGAERFAKIKRLAVERELRGKDRQSETWLPFGMP